MTKNHVGLLLTVAALLLVGNSRCKRCGMYEDRNETNSAVPPSTGEYNERNERVPRRKVVKIGVLDKRQVNELANMGLDLWEVRQNYVIASVTDNEMAKIERLEFGVEVLFQSQAEYESFVKSRKYDTEP